MLGGINVNKQQSNNNNMPKTKHGQPFVPKTITIRKDQSDYIQKNTINLSKFVQKQVDELMKR